MSNFRFGSTPNFLHSVLSFSWLISLLFMSLSSLFLVMSNFRFGSTPNFLHSVLSFLPLLPTTLFLLFNQTMTEKSVFGFKFLGLVETVVDQGKTSCFTTTKVCPESESKDKI